MRGLFFEPVQPPPGSRHGLRLLAVSEVRPGPTLTITERSSGAGQGGRGNPPPMLLDQEGAHSTEGPPRTQEAIGLRAAAESFLPEAPGGRAARGGPTRPGRLAPPGPSARHQPPPPRPEPVGGGRDETGDVAARPPRRDQEQGMGAAPYPGGRIVSHEA
jgi:hypothetical protein